MNYIPGSHIDCVALPKLLNFPVLYLTQPLKNMNKSQVQFIVWLL